MSSPVTPWWEVLKLRDEVVHASGSIDDVQMSLFQAVHGTVSDRPPYADAHYFGEITHPSPLFTDLMAKVAVRLGGGEKHTRSRALWRLDQAMGGGKSHGLIGLWHLAAHPQALSGTDIGRDAFARAAVILDEKPPTDLNNPVVVVLACDNMTAGKGAAEFDGPAQTLHERFLWRLFQGDNNLYLRYRDGYADKHRIVEALTAVGRPVLILVDEILDYVRQLSLTENADLAIKDMAFLRALLDSVNDVPNVAAVVVMIASEADNIDLDDAGQKRRQELDDLLIRNGETATINDNTDFAAILRRRLFDGHAAAEVLKATSIAFATRMTGPWRTKVFDAVPVTASPDFADEVARCYPFHPQLMALAEQEWAKLAGFQRVRSTIRIFAATAHAQYQRGKRGEWAPLLVGPGDLPLSDPTVREAVINSGLIVDTRTQANYRQIASADIVGAEDQRGAARELDRARTDGIIGPLNPRAAERAATCLFLCSVIGARAGGRQGATEAELKAAMFVPDANYPVGEADTVLSELLDVEGGGLSSVESLAGKGGQAARLFMSTRRTLNMLVKASRTSVTDDDRDEELARTVERLMVTGPFKTKLFVETKPALSPLEVLTAAGIDDARSTRLVVLDPRQFSLLNGIDKDTREAIRAAWASGRARSLSSGHRPPCSRPSTPKAGPLHGVQPLATSHGTGSPGWTPYGRTTNSPSRPAPNAQKPNGTWRARSVAPTGTSCSSGRATRMTSRASTGPSRSSPTAASRRWTAPPYGSLSSPTARRSTRPHSPQRPCSTTLTRRTTAVPWMSCATCSGPRLACRCFRLVRWICSVRSTKLSSLGNSGSSAQTT